MSWSLIYRPRQLSQLHLASVRQTLEHLTVSGHFPQALLFAGPKGTGKTSAARIIAAMLNDPANAEAVSQLFLGKKSKLKPVLVDSDPNSQLTQQICLGQSFVVSEIDAASHGSVDDVRALKERASLPPQVGLMTVYILDEVHMMSSQAFNALLKLIEEPPAHSVFILATTELHKIPATIASRCTLVQFKKATSSEILAVFARICQAEKLTADPEALQMLADLAEGSFRDAVKWLELTTLDNHVTVENVEKLVGVNLKAAVEDLVLKVIARDARSVVRLFETWRSKQVDQMALNKAVFGFLHDELMSGLIDSAEAKAKISPQISQFLLQQLLEANLTTPSPIPHLALELKLLEIIQKSKAKKAGSPTPTNGEKPETETPKPEVKKNSTQASVTKKAQAQEATSAQLANPELGKILVERWTDFVSLIQAQNSTVATLLKSATPSFTPQGRVVAGVAYSFHRDQLKQSKFEIMFRLAAEQIVGQIVPIQFELVSAQSPIPVEIVGQNSVTLSSLATEALM